MNYKMNGIITKIGEKKTLDNGAVVLDYIVEETADNGYKTPFNFNFYKGKDYIEFVDKFLEFNKVGDSVTVEFTVRGKEYQGKTYNSLSHWAITKAGTPDPVLANADEDPLPL